MSEGVERREILVAGLGGQGVILAGVILGQAAVNDGLFAAGSNSYGAQARGSACKAEVVVSGRPIDYPHVEAADLIVAMSQGAYDAYRGTLKKGGRLLFDEGLVRSVAGNETETGFDVTGTALRELGNKQAANVLWVGLLSGLSGWFSLKGLQDAAQRHVPERFMELNLKALALGFKLGSDAAAERHGR